MGIPIWRLGNHYLKISYGLAQMSRYLELVEVTVFEQPQEYKRLIDNLSEEWPIDEKIEWDEATDTEQLQELDGDFTRIFHSSFLFSWYSFIETYLLSSCEVLKLPNNINHRDKGIDRAKKRLLIKKYKKDKQHWNELKIIQNLRNQIVHNGNQLKFSFRIKPEQKSKYTKISTSIHGVENNIWIPRSRHFDLNACKYADKHNIIRYEGNSFLKLSLSPNKNFSAHLIKFGKQFFKKIHDDLYEIEVSSKKV